MDLPFSKAKYHYLKLSFLTSTRYLEGKKKKQFDQVSFYKEKKTFLMHSLFYFFLQFVPIPDRLIGSRNLQN